MGWHALLQKSEACLLDWMRIEMFNTSISCANITQASELNWEASVRCVGVRRWRWCSSYPETLQMCHCFKQKDVLIFLLWFAYLTIYVFSRDDYISDDRWATHVPPLKGAEELVLMINCRRWEFPIHGRSSVEFCVLHTLLYSPRLNVQRASLELTVWTHSFHRFRSV